MINDTTKKSSRELSKTSKILQGEKTAHLKLKMLLTHIDKSCSK